jgi:predicted metal-binding membrane protein
MSTYAEAKPRVRDPAVALWSIAAACWSATILLATTGGEALGHHDVVVEQSTLPRLVRIAAYLSVWTVMVGAMMLPTTVPIARLVAAVSAGAPRPGRARFALAVSYLAVWSGFGLAALVNDIGVHAAVDRWPWLDGHSGLILAATLAVAGAFQFSGLKDRCLTACRDPFSMLWRHYGRGALQAWRLGIRHALSCLGCCWALMLLMFGTGVGSLAWMLLLTGVMVAEKTTRLGRRLSAPIGVGLLVTALILALASLQLGPFANLLPGAT